MANGIYAAASGLATQQDRIDAIANDLANVDTVGYRSERLGFKDLLYGTQDGVPVGAGSAAVHAGRSAAAGSLAASSSPLALAITGPGYFQVTRADGTKALTRDGNFQIDQSGSLVTQNGEKLVPPIALGKGTQPEDVSIAADGTVSISGSKTGTVGKIALVEVPSPDGLLPLGGNDLAVTTASGAATAAKSSTLLSGQLEQSNVDVARSMTDLLDAQQSYSLASRALSVQDQLMQMANELRS